MGVKPWKRVEPTVVTKVGHRTVVEKHFEMPDGHVEDWTTMHEEGCAAATAVALTPDNKVIVARQFRPGPEKIFDDLPGGFVDPGETPEQSIVRELIEETGYKAGEVEYLGVCYHDAYQNGKRHYFLITDCVPVGDGPADDPSAPVEIRLLDIDTFLRTSKKGLLSDPGGVLLAYDKLLALKAGQAS